MWKSSRKTAVKAFERQLSYGIELDCYQRFKKYRITRLQGLSVPKLRSFDDRLYVIEMGIVAPPYILDFAKAWLDRAADYSPEVMDDWEQGGQELFGPRWSDVKAVLWALRQYGIYYYDAKPGNINFGDPDEEL